MKTCAAPDCENEIPQKTRGKRRKWCSNACCARTAYRRAHPDAGQEPLLGHRERASLAAFENWLAEPTMTNEGQRVNALAALIEGR